MPTDLPAIKPLLLSGFLLAGLALAGCGSDEGFKGVAEAAGMATTPQESKAFVRATRPAEMEYIPVGSSIPVAQLCPGPNPPPAYVPSGQAARFKTPTPMRDPKDPCKPRSNFENIQNQLDAKQKANEAAGNAARAQGASTQPPKPAQIPPLN